MRRAIHRFLGLVLAATLVPAAAFGQAGTMKINGIGLIDYARKPDLKVGQWVKYRYTGSDAAGVAADYTATIAIIGEDRFWGEECFWVETVTESKTQAPVIILTLMSYDVFKDPDPQRNFIAFQRKLVMGLKDDGTPDVQLPEHRPGTARGGGREGPREGPGSHVYFDTLGTDTTQTPVGTYRTLQVKMRVGGGSSRDVRDSTEYLELHENRIEHFAAEVPVTGLAREDFEHTLTRRMWLVGRSQTGNTVTLERSTGVTNLIAMGTGYKSKVAPAEWQRSQREQDAAAAAPRAARAPAKRAKPPGPAPPPMGR